jgi:hypothetical protein
VLTGGVCIRLINERLKVPVHDADASVATDTRLSEPDPAEQGLSLVSGGYGQGLWPPKEGKAPLKEARRFVLSSDL